VLAIDTFLTGETDRHDERLKDKFFTTFYRTDAAERVQDIVTALACAQQQVFRDLSGAWRNGSPETPVPQALSGPDRAVSKGAAGVDLIGLGRSGIDCLFARAFAGVGGSTIIDADRFDAGDQAFADRLFVPGIRRVGDIRTAAALIAPGRLTIHNAAKGFPADWIKRAYAAAGLPNSIDVTNGALAPEQMVTRL